jgi:hypothetical protein
MRRTSSKNRNIDPALADESGRFVRQDDFVTVTENGVRYLACDHETGLEVSWHELILDPWPSSDEWLPLEARLERLKSLKHDSLFSIHHYWINRELRRIVFITDAIPNKSVLEDFVRENAVVRPKVVIRWFRPMLEVLRFLHRASPPIVHGRIHPFSIFVRGKAIKIDPPHFLKAVSAGFAITPFTPPELLIGEETVASDIWRFGMALLCVVARQTPYAECKRPVDLITKLQSWEPPDCLAAVEDPIASDLIAACLTAPAARPTAEELAGHAYFTRDLRAENGEVPKGGGLVVLFTNRSTASMPHGPDIQTQGVEGERVGAAAESVLIPKEA